MGDPLRFPSPDPQEQPQIDRAASGLEPLPGESPMWFRRFVLYRDLGYKRSLRKAIAAERAGLHLVQATTSHAGENDQPRPDTQEVLHSVVHVPESWRKASQRYHWQERAAAYELALIRKMAEHHASQLQLTYANKYRRVVTLNELIEVTRENSRKASFGVTVEQAHMLMLKYTKELRNLLSALRSEMQGIDEQALQASIEANALAERRRQIDNAKGTTSH